MTGLLIVKFRRDAWASWPRLLMMVMAMAVSLTAFAAVLFAWSASGRETQRAYLSTEPASATILLDQAVDVPRMAALVAETGRRPGVLAVTGRTQFTSAIRVNGDERAIPLQLFVATPDDPMRMVTFRGQQRPGLLRPARCSSAATLSPCWTSRSVTG
jgi:putative ABC transport system permease protein